MRTVEDYIPQMEGNNVLVSTEFTFKEYVEELLMKK